MPVYDPAREFEKILAQQRESANRTAAFAAQRSQSKNEAQNAGLLAKLRAAIAEQAAQYDYGRQVDLLDRREGYVSRGREDEQAYETQRLQDLDRLRARAAELDFDRDLQQLGVQHGYGRELAADQQGYTLDQMGAQNEYRLGQMGLAHEQDRELLGEQEVYRGRETNQRLMAEQEQAMLDRRHQMQRLQESSRLGRLDMGLQDQFQQGRDQRLHGFDRETLGLQHRNRQDEMRLGGELSINELEVARQQNQMQALDAGLIQRLQHLDDNEKHMNSAAQPLAKQWRAKVTGIMKNGYRLQQDHPKVYYPAVQEAIAEYDSLGLGGSDKIRKPPTPQDQYRTDAVRLGTNLMPLQPGDPSKPVVSLIPNGKGGYTEIESGSVTEDDKKKWIMANREKILESLRQQQSNVLFDRVPNASQEWLDSTSKEWADANIDKALDREWAGIQRSLHRGATLEPDQYEQKVLAEEVRTKLPDLQMKIEGLKLQINAAIQSGDTDKANMLQFELSPLLAERNRLEGGIGQDQLRREQQQPQAGPQQPMQRPPGPQGAMQAPPPPTATRQIGGGVQQGQPPQQMQRDRMGRLGNMSQQPAPPQQQPPPQSTPEFAGAVQRIREITSKPPDQRTRAELEEIVALEQILEGLLSGQ